MNCKHALPLLMLLLGAFCLQAQPAHRYLRKGNEAYEGQDYRNAEEYYRKSLSERSTSRGSYNLGNSIYQQGRYKESIRRFEHAAQTLKDKEAKASAFHNLGNAYLQDGQLEKAIEAYKNSLRLRPEDQSTKYNLAMAQRLLKEQQQRQQQKEQEQGENEQQEQQQQQQGGQPQGQQDQQQQQQGQQDTNQQQQQNANQDQKQGGQSQPAGQSLSREEAERLLQIIEEEELRVLEKMRNQQGTPPKKSDKDW